MEKNAEIREDITPPEDNESFKKIASEKDKLDRLEDHFKKRTADRVEEKLK